MKKIHFVSGLPRAGSTLLVNILAQNPRFQVTSTSGILEIIYLVRNKWDELAEFKASPNDKVKVRVMRAILATYHRGSRKPVVFDKGRGWLGFLELVEVLLQREAKVLVPVRDLREVLASFEKLYRANVHIFQSTWEKTHYGQWQTLEGRLKIWTGDTEPVGLAFNWIKDAVARGFRNRMHFVRYDMLTGNPEQEMRDIYEFLGEEPFKHDFNNVKQVTQENDFIYGFRNLHKIRSKVKPQTSQWPTILGKASEPYTGQELW